MSQATLRNRGDALLHRLGLHALQFRALFRAYLLIDFRSQLFGRATNTGPKAAISPLFWVVGQYLAIGGLTSAILFARVDAYAFALFNLGVSMLVMLTAVVVEFNEVVLDSGELDVLGHLPIQTRTYSAARMANLLSYVLLMTAALNLFPAIVGLGLRDTSWTFLPAYAAAALLGNVLVCAAVIVVYALILSSGPRDSAREVLAWTQMIIILVAFYGGQAVFRDSQGRLEMAAYRLPEWVAWTPPAWLAAFVDSAGPHAGGVRWWILAGMVSGVAALCTAAVAGLSSSYGRMQPASHAWRRTRYASPAIPGSLVGPLSRRLVRGPQEAAAYGLCVRMLRRDPDLKMRSWPALGMAFALALLGLISGQLADPFESPGQASLLSLVSLYALTLPIPGLIHNISFSRDHAAAWALQCAPLRDAAGFSEGIRKAATHRVLWPCLGVLTVIFVMAWGHALHALAYLLVGILLIEAGGHAAMMGVFRHLPFSRPLARGATLGSIIFFVSIVNATAGVLVAGHFLALQMSWGYELVVGALFVLVISLRYFARRTIMARFGHGVRP